MCHEERNKQLKSLYPRMDSGNSTVKRVLLTQTKVCGPLEQRANEEGGRGGIRRSLWEKIRDQTGKKSGRSSIVRKK